ncbi:MAG: bifunctional demethylmenaquinone methyltransferase/2-methoxy-6-polyprenyl-1,4-benzoquinol methylase UbiE [Bacteroidales bacterium]|nr:bifunctional demethylmenaquinone methyltransferase/2-methoxy-6-polyprenyl-1,4-benzoquinol methylase UbiE [Bacteroidales bacterium]
MDGPKTAKIGQMFDAIAPGYDRLNHLLSIGTDRSWRRRALREIITTEHPQAILDLACGTGDFSIAIAEKAHPDTRIDAVDLSEGMLHVMREKLAARGLAARICPLQGNGEALPFPDNRFDRVTIAFGIRNFEHRETALREILRVLKPGGRLVILELSVPAFPPIRWAYKLYFTHLLPRIGGRLTGEKAAYRYLPASVLAFPGKQAWMDTMTACGYGNVRHKAFSLGICRMYAGEKTPKT